MARIVSSMLVAYATAAAILQTSALRGTLVRLGLRFPCSPSSCAPSGRPLGRGYIGSCDRLYRCRVAGRLRNVVHSVAAVDSFRLDANVRCSGGCAALHSRSNVGGARLSFRRYRGVHTLFALIPLQLRAKPQRQHASWCFSRQTEIWSFRVARWRRTR